MYLIEICVFAIVLLLAGLVLQVADFLDEIREIKKLLKHIKDVEDYYYGIDDEDFCDHI